MFTIKQGCCLELMKDIEGESVDLILTDPPYGTTHQKWDEVIPFEPMWDALHRIIKPDGVIALFGVDPFSCKLKMSNLERWRYDWIWNKLKPANFSCAKIRPLKYCESIHIFSSNKKSRYFPQLIKRLNGRVKSAIKAKQEKNHDGPEIGLGKYLHQLNPDFKYPMDLLLDFPSVWPNSREKNPHPTQKPVPLLEYLIKTYTNEGETVLDFTMGSGSTGVAALNLNRKFIGYELDENYFKIAEDRIKEAAGQTEQLALLG